MKTLSLKSSVKITRALFVMVALFSPLVASAGTRHSGSSLEKHIQTFIDGRALQASAKWSAFLPAKTSVTPKKCVYINGWTLPDNPVVGQSYPIAWQGYSAGPSYVMLYTKPPGGSWIGCGSGGVPSGGGWVSASGGFGFFASGTWEFAVAPGGTSPTVASASLVVP